MHRLAAALLALAVVTFAPAMSSACSTGTTSWSHSGTCGSYVPFNGSFAEANFSGDIYRTEVTFTLTSSNVTSILDYNAGGRPGTNCSDDAFLTLDVTAVPDNDDTLDAYAIYTNLPNPKKDLEDDAFFGDGFREESEVTALGTVSARSYYMRTYWNDKRTGYVSARGQIQAQFAMSSQPWYGGDYNNCQTAAANQIINRYLGCVGCS